MRKQLIAITILVATAGSTLAAQPSEGPLGLAVDNIVEGKYDEGTVLFDMRSDHSSTVTTPDGQKIAGRWLADERYVCFVNSGSVPLKHTGVRCEDNLFADKKLGESWSQVDSYGETVILTIRPKK